MSLVIKAEKLSKRFRLNNQKSSNGTLRDVLAQSLRNPFRPATNADEAETLWALRDVSFEIESGETLGIVGANGAGKSTLLKILSRITKPTSGRAVLHGRVGSLLEVGTGFHQELTGRENIFLNGAILGMKKTEIAEKFDEIVAFAEVERFIDTPVKHYSSGMYMRLAFAVAAHLEPEILIVDEVLAVGDAAFQKKCLGKMNEVASEGRTVIFVSHNAAALARLCRKGLYLEHGNLKNYDVIQSVLAQYHQDSEVDNLRESAERTDFAAVPEGTLRYLSWKLLDASTNQPYSIYSRETAHFELTLASKRPTADFHFLLAIQDEQQRNVIVTHNVLGGANSSPIKRGRHKVHWTIQLPIKAGTYKLRAEIHSGESERILDYWEAVQTLTVLPFSEYQMPPEQQGIVNLPIEFGIEAENL